MRQIKSYAYTAVVCLAGGRWHEHQGTFEIETSRAAQPPGSVERAAERDAQRRYPKASHVFVLRTRKTAARPTSPAERAAEVADQDPRVIESERQAAEVEADLVARGVFDQVAREKYALGDETADEALAQRLVGIRQRLDENPLIPLVERKAAA